MYSVNEHFYSLQGEGYNTGKPAYFVRLSGCNVHCAFCDSPNSWEETANEKVSALEILGWIQKTTAKNVVITGGEPLLYNLDDLCQTLRKGMPDINLWLETSGTERFSGKFDWICLSPKKHCLPLTENYAKADELKIIITGREDFDFAVDQAKKVRSNCDLFLQVEWSRRQELTALIIDFIQAYPQWRLSVQVHKFLHIQ